MPMSFFDVSQMPRRFIHASAMSRSAQAGVHGRGHEQGAHDGRMPALASDLQAEDPRRHRVHEDGDGQGEARHDGDLGLVGLFEVMKYR